MAYSSRMVPGCPFAFSYPLCRSDGSAPITSPAFLYGVACAVCGVIQARRLELKIESDARVLQAASSPFASPRV